MRAYQLSRNNLASLISELKDVRNLTGAGGYGEPSFPPSSQNVFACWDDDPFLGDDLPRLLVVRDDEIDDFFAWAVTFLPSIRPLTAFMRVLSWSDYAAFRDTHPEAERKVTSALVGAILGEVMINATGRGFLENLPLIAFESTYIATLGQTLFSGFDPSLMQSTSNSWRFARKLTEQLVRPVSPELLNEVWTVLLRLAECKSINRDLARSSLAISEGCLELREHGRISSFTLQEIAQGRASSFFSFDPSNLSKEHRVELFEDAVKALVNEKLDQLSTSFLIGYLASMVSGGSIEHAHLVFPIQDHLPTTMIWYGICAGLHPDSRVLTDYNGLGLRLIRMMNRRNALLSIPTCDIAITELEILFRGTPRARSFRQTNSSFLRIEVAPTITTVVKWPPRPLFGSQLNLFEGDDEHVAPEFEYVREVIFSLRKSLALAESKLGQVSQPYSPTIRQRGKKSH